MPDHKPTKLIAMNKARLPHLAAMLGAACALTTSLQAHAHGPAKPTGQPIERCETAGLLSAEDMTALNPPYAQKADFEKLEASELWKNVISRLLVNKDKDKPCFGFSDTKLWTKVVSKFPTDVVAIQATENGETALVYVSGIPDYLMETPKVFSSFKPGLTYAIFRIAAKPTPDNRSVHSFVSMGSIGILANGVSIFNYTDSFSYNDKSVWAYDANVAEAPIVNSDISHATPSNLPQFPKSRGIYHNHQMSVELLETLKDPYFSGRAGHSKLIGFAIDSTPIYGPLGYTSNDASSGLKVLKSSYVPRNWLAADQKGTGHRSSIPEWAVVNWDGSNLKGENLLNLFQKPKADILYADGATEGAVSYKGTDEKLANEIAKLQESFGLQRDASGYVFWEAKVEKPDGGTATTKNYVLKSSDLWGPDFDEEILPASYQVADIDKFYFKARLGTFAEDYAYIPGYGNLDFFNGIESYLPDRNTSAYHYVASFSGELDDEERLSSASFPYFIGIQYKNRPDPFNESGSSSANIIFQNSARIAFFEENGESLKTIFDLGIVGKNDQDEPIRSSVPEVWHQKLSED